MNRYDGRSPATRQPNGYRPDSFPPCQGRRDHPDFPGHVRSARSREVRVLSPIAGEGGPCLFEGQKEADRTARRRGGEPSWADHAAAHPTGISDIRSPGRLELGTNPVEVRQAPEWQTVLPNQPAGEAIRAMAYMGKERAKESAVKIRRVLGPAEWAKIKRARSRLPEWVVKAVDEAERVA